MKVYIIYMQKGVDYIGVGVGAIILNSKGQIFLAQRGPKAKNERGLWEAPGGGVEFGETLKETIVREMLEEFEINIEVIELVGAHDHILPEEKQHWVAVQYLCKLISGEPKILESEKCSEIGWFNIDQALSMPITIPTKLGLLVLKDKLPQTIKNVE